MTSHKFAPIVFLFEIETLAFSQLDIIFLDFWRPPFILHITVCFGSRYDKTVKALQGLSWKAAVFSQDL